MKHTHEQKSFSRILATICITLTTSAHAQSVGNVAMPGSSASAAAPQTSTATTSATSSASGVLSNVSAGYLGIFNGPEADFYAPKRLDNKDMYVSNRLAVRYNFSDSINAGYQARVATIFQPGKLEATNETHRLFANFRGLAKTQMGALTLTPRVMLPTSNAAHDQKMLPSPELIANYEFAPAGSRFNFALGNTASKKLYQNNEDQKMQSFYSIANIEASYQMSPISQMTFGLYPEYEITRSTAMNNTSNEVDMGVSIDVAKGWSVNPYVATELKGLHEGNLGKQTAFNLTLSGTLL